MRARSIPTRCSTGSRAKRRRAVSSGTRVAATVRPASRSPTAPSAQQIGNAQARPNVDYRVEPGEHCSLPDASADLATVAQALHWFDFARYFAQVARVLKPRGVLAAWSYSDCRVTLAIDVLK